MASSLNPISFPGFSTYFKETLINPTRSPSPSVLAKDFLTIKSQLFSDQKGLPSSSWNAKIPRPAHASICVSKSMRWWEKTPQPNMIEIKSAQELVDTLSNSGDRLVIVEFYSPSCGGCKALHPKLCQVAESNPDALFLQVNNQELKPMCHALHVHVLPLFRFYKGSQGKLCSFTCNIATIKKLKDALLKHKSECDECDPGPAKGLEESELLTLASTGQISYHLPSESSEEEDHGPADGSDESDLLALSSIGQISYHLPLKSTDEDLVLDEINPSINKLLLA